MTQRGELSALCSFSRRKKSTRKMLSGEKIHFHLCTRFAISNAICVLEQPLFFRWNASFIFASFPVYMPLFAYLSVWLSVCGLFVCLFICLPVYLSVCLSVCLSICCLFMTKPASQGWCPGHSCSCPSVVCQSRDYKRARVAHLLLCNRSRSDHKHRSHNFKITISPN